MSPYVEALVHAWEQLLEWHADGNFSPRSEEDIQCFLYYGLVHRLGTTKNILTKPTSGNPEKLAWLDGKLQVGDMHFPDMLLVDDEGDALVAIEIKYKRVTRSTIFPGCLADVEKLEKHHKARTQYFILFDSNKSHIFIDEYQFCKLREAAPNCNILHFPAKLNPSKYKELGRLSAEKQRSTGVDFVARGKAGARKAMFGISAGDA